MDPLKAWLPHRDMFLDELLRRDGMPHLSPPLCTCGVATALYRCNDCAFNDLLCQKCLIDCHARLPLHCVEKWNDSFFERISLCDLGLRIQLGHENETCHVPAPASEPVMVIHTNGIHLVTVDFCNCSNSLPRVVQMLRMAWWPASMERPQTAATFSALDLFHSLTLQSKINMYDFYLSLEPTISELPNSRYKRYRELYRIIRQFRHIMTVKRSGRGHDPSGIEGTQAGECAVECPACPQPGRNITQTYDSIAPSDRWKYALIVAIDANFRLKLKKRTAHDTPLGDGWSYFVPSVPYKEHVSKYVNQPEISSCDSTFRAIDHANTRSNEGLAATGVAGVTCARHAINRANGFGDLQRGERYCNMDYVVLATLSGTSVKKLVFSYDIACQWFKNFRSRMAVYPEKMRLDMDQVETDAGIPKLHCKGHGPKCQTAWSFNYIKGSARTCGESIEQIWSGHNAVSMSTREMTPASRQNTIDDHLGSWNFRKVVGLGKYLLSLLQEAIPMKAKHRIVLEELRIALDSDLVTEWERMIKEWDEDRQKPDPYAEDERASGMADVRLEILKEEAADVAAGTTPAHEMTASVFLTNGFELEEQQRVLREKGKGAKAANTVYKSAEMQQKRSALQRRIFNWYKIQSIYMPGVVLLRAEVSPTDDDRSGAHKPETIHLLLPSQISAAERAAVCLPDLVDKEFRLRVGQCDDALHQIRRLLRIRSNLWHYKRGQVFGQRSATRTRTLIAKFDERINRMAERYRAGRAALIALNRPGDWSTRFLALNDSDIQGPRQDDETVLVTPPSLPQNHWISEGRRDFTWIWLAPKARLEGDAEAERRDVNEGMRVEYCKARARAIRWEEEVELVVEEMRRTIAFLEWRARWWRSLIGQRTDVSPSLASGLVAYALKQSHIQMQLAQHFSKLWRPVLHQHCLPHGFLHDVAGRATTYQAAPQVGDVTEGVEAENDDADDCSDEDDAIE
ncbi:hypothetical protein BD410DRAFT_734211 [Rickenella mellea]|uniref:CxC2-like cysteine cluster KDZ transposase-associated domain-containing protein n=1 Tax=Rickenella mellea TaxID=50990 RepID=A0A4Y7PH67_9AGAM|nr:hypothetical protein BD410DRAFT_734211 [Rickenella mellea]